MGGGGGGRGGAGDGEGALELEEVVKSHQHGCLEGKFDG